MRFSEQWLREWVNPPVSSEELAEQLTMAGLEVDSVEPVAGVFDKVVIGQVRTLEPHPDADKLRVSQVDVGADELLQIVCGAPNVAPGIKVPTALVGARLPGDIKIKKAKLRGVASSGMLCSARELGLSEDHAGLMVLPEDAPLGEDIRNYLQLDDVAIEVDLTPNRSDCLGIEGIAREVGVLNRCAVSPPDMPAVAAVHDQQFPVTISAPEACPRYLGRVVTGVDAKAATPLWMQERLRRSGLRSLGPVVDVTNYVMLELGQPMHGFDLAVLQQGIEVRVAQPGEKLILLDGREIELDSDTLVIADAGGPLALAGIMGGEHSGVSEATRDVFLECAFFAPTAIAGRARRYGMQTDSSYRFERGVDPELAARAMQRATALLLDITGGEAGPVTEVANPEHLPAPARIQLRQQRVSKLLGLELPAAEIEDILTRLGCVLERRGEDWEVTAPGYRFDMSIEADLIEDIGRIYGYNRLPTSEPVGRLQMIAAAEACRPVERFSTLLVDRDYQEAITYSFVDQALQAAIDPDGQPIALANPLSADLAVMRTSLWPGLLRAAEHNLNRQQNRVRLFEKGLKFNQQDNEYKQENYISGLICGDRMPEQWGAPAEPVDFFDIKGDVEAMLALTGCDERFSFRVGVHPALHPGRSACVYRDGDPVGWLGTLHPQLARKLQLPRHIQLFELQLAALERGAVPAFEPVSRFPAIRRDLAFTVDQGLDTAQILAIIADLGLAELKETRVFDVYQGQGVETGLKSIALGLILQDSSRTLVEQDVEEIITRVTTSLQEQAGASLRE